DNCEIESITGSHQPGDFFPVGETDVTYTATDVHGNQGFSGFRITVIDIEPPEISQLPDIVAESEPGMGGATIYWDSPAIADNCEIESLISNFMSGDFFPIGTTEVVYTATDANGNSGYSGFSITVLDAASYIININEGWSGISSYFVPDVPDIETMFSSITDELVILYNFSGTYWPSVPINTLEEWDFYSGYVIKVTDDVILTVTGYEIADKTVNISEGWNLIPVFSNEPSMSILGGLPGFVIAKGVASPEIIWPEYNINTMPFLLTGKAYYVYTTQAGSITYSGGSKEYIHGNSEILPVTPWNKVILTPYTHLVAFNPESLKPLQPGDLIAAFNQEGFCSGVVEISTLKNSQILILNGDDPTTETIEGYLEGEPIALKCYRQNTGEIFEVEVKWEEYLNHSGLFETHGLSAIKEVNTTSTGILTNSSGRLMIYPNPTRGTFTIEGLKGEADVMVINLLGDEVYHQNTNLPAEIDLSDQPKSIYFIHIECSNKMFIEKLIIK
ncbi:MAG: HYR domain-containing protein, partial [Bacteroidales bacterium]|nr:HYR domain-containing protein [Bacteroidales bacterium]